MPVPPGLAPSVRLSKALHVLGIRREVAGPFDRTDQVGRQLAEREFGAARNEPLQCLAQYSGAACIPALREGREAAIKIFGQPDRNRSPCGLGPLATSSVPTLASLVLPHGKRDLSARPGQRLRHSFQERLADTGSPAFLHLCGFRSARHRQATATGVSSVKTHGRSCPLSSILASRGTCGTRRALDRALGSRWAAEPLDPIITTISRTYERVPRGMPKVLEFPRFCRGLPPRGL